MKHVQDQNLEPPEDNYEALKEAAESRLEEELEEALEDGEVRLNLAYHIKEESGVERYCSKLREETLNTLIDQEREEPHDCVSDDN